MSDVDPNLRVAELDWMGGLHFEGGAPGGPRIAMDSTGTAGPSPVVALLLAGGACSGIDVVSILEKMQVKLARCRISLTGRRAEDHPRRFTEITMTFHLSGEGLTEAKAARAVELSVTKYCSVMLTLDPAMPVRTEIVIEA